jgi:CubicO group peptidase (beta-lactamase class C family)
MKNFYTTIVSALIFCSTFAQTGIEVSEMTDCDVQFQNFITTHGIPGMTVAYALNGKLSYMRGFGNSDLASTEDVQPYNMFRVASISKPITSIGIMKMMEDGLLTMNDKVFGPGGILENHWVFATANITDTRVYDITVQMLLEHSAGWDSSINCNPNPTSPYPWFFQGCHPIDIPLHITQHFGQPNPVKEEHLIQYILEKQLNYDPGTTYAYSNMGFLILSEIIEELSGMDYEAWMKQEILHPLGIFDMHIAENLLADKREREGEYVAEEAYYTYDLYGSGQQVPWTYGGAPVNSMDGHGGWIATARDLVRLLVAVDNFATSPDILSSASITTMTTPSATNANYAKGWAVNQYNNWWHNGALGGTASVWVRTSGGGGYIWAFILNKRITTPAAQADSFWADFDNLGWNCLYATTAVPAHDFFDSPTVNANGHVATNITNTSMDLSWTNGNGSNRIVVAKEIINTGRASQFDAFPMDGTDYSANNQFGSGDDLGDGSFVVYNGTGTSVTLSNLNSGTEYAIRVYEYSQNTNTANNALYMLGNVEDFNQSTTTLGIDSNSLNSLIKISPTVVSDVLNISIDPSLTNLNFEVYNLLGTKISNGNIRNNESIRVTDLSSGIYLIKFKNENQIANFKFIKQ